MKILHELSWLWETLGIALLAAAICIACAALICKAAKKKLSKKVLAVIGAILAIILIARTPMPL
jgi:ABC-type Fe3+ transport system permease subunit